MNDMYCTIAGSMNVRSYGLWTMPKTITLITKRNHN